MLEPIEKKSLSDEVFEQLRDQIVCGDRQPGSTLPGERSLSEALEVNRGAVREALKRLEQAGLVARRHGGATRVLDYRETAGSGLLVELLFTSRGIDVDVARGVMELRTALAADAAGRAARRNPEVAEHLFGIVDRMRGEEGLEALMEANLEFWEHVIDASENVAYRLTSNSVREVYERLGSTLVAVLTDEITDRDAHEDIAEAIAEGDVGDAEHAARELLARGERCVARLTELEEESDE